MDFIYCIYYLNWEDIHSSLTTSTLSLNRNKLDSTNYKPIKSNSIFISFICIFNLIIIIGILSDLTINFILIPKFSFNNHIWVLYNTICGISSRELTIKMASIASHIIHWLLSMLIEYLMLLRMGITRGPPFCGMVMQEKIKSLLSSKRALTITWNVRKTIFTWQ